MSTQKKNMFDPANFSEGGLSSVKGVEGVVVASAFMVTNWARKDGTIPTYVDQKTGQTVSSKPSTIWNIDVKLDDLDDLVNLKLSVGSVGVPSKDNVLPAKDLEGDFLVNPKGGEFELNKNTAAAFLLESLGNASFDFGLFMEQGAKVIIGYRFAFDEQIRRDVKTGKDIGKKETVIVTKIIHGAGAVQGQKGPSAPGKVQGTATVPPKAGNGVTTPSAALDHAALAAELISEVLAETSPLAKGQVSVKVNTKLQGRGLSNEDRLKTLRAATSDEVLASGPWSFDKTSLTAL